MAAVTVSNEAAVRIEPPDHQGPRTSQRGERGLAVCGARAEFDAGSCTARSTSPGAAPSPAPDDELRDGDPELPAARRPDHSQAAQRHAQRPRPAGSARQTFPLTVASPTRMSRPAPRTPAGTAAPRSTPAAREPRQFGERAGRGDLQPRVVDGQRGQPNPVTSISPRTRTCGSKYIQVPGEDGGARPQPIQVGPVAALSNRRDRVQIQSAPLRSPRGVRKATFMSPGVRKVAFQARRRHPRPAQ